MDYEDRFEELGLPEESRIEAPTRLKCFCGGQIVVEFSYRSRWQAEVYTNGEYSDESDYVDNMEDLEPFDIRVRCVECSRKLYRLNEDTDKVERIE